MKALILSFILVSTNAFAIDLCEYQDWGELLRGLDKANIHQFKEADIRNLGQKEIKLIHKTVMETEWSTEYTEEEAVEEFLEMYEGRIGDLAGEITYYRAGNKTLIGVIYYPGDNVYGAYWFEKNGKYELIAHVDDSSIVCRKN